MLYLIGLGIHDEQDISLKALAALKKADKVYAELYTSFYNGDLKKVEGWIGKKITVLDRGDLEEDIEKNVLRDSTDKDTALLVCGDPLIATTHSDILLRAHKAGVKVRVIHSSSIYSAIAETGLHIYKFGKTTTIPYPVKGYQPTSPYDVVRDNLSLGLHTLVLLDVKAQEERYMTVNQGIKFLFELEEEKKEGIIRKDMLVVGVARLGGDSMIKAASAEKLMDYSFGGPPHSIIIPGELHFTEEEMLDLFR